MSQPRYYSLSAFFKERFGGPVRKVTLDAGMTCPNRDGTLGRGGCIYCNEQGAGSGAASRGVPVHTQLHEGVRRMSGRGQDARVLAYFQAYSNTYAPIGRLESLWRDAIAVQEVVGLAIGTRPDCIDERILDLLAELSRTTMVWLELGLQSCHDRTLRAINRCHDFSAYDRAVRAARARGILVCTHLIMGLPGETTSDMLETVETVRETGVDGVKLHVLYVARGTALATLFERGGYRCLERDEYAGIVCDSLERLPADTVIQRLCADPHPEELLSPAWTLDKQGVLSRIAAILAERDTWQGRTLGTPMSAIGQSVV